jgi:hypothetical protein
MDGERGCCSEPVCPRAELARLLTPNDPIEQQIERLAEGVAQTCKNLSDEDLEICFSEYFKISAECVLFDRFREIYRARNNAAGAGAP